LRSACTGWRTCLVSLPPGRLHRENNLPYYIGAKVGAAKFFRTRNTIDEPVDPERQYKRAYQQDQVAQAEVEGVQQPAAQREPGKLGPG